MLKPYLLNAVQDEGKIIKEFKPTVTVQKICSDATITQLKACLEGVCTDGTAKSLFKNTPYKVAGKTGTALVANGNRGYADKIYQSSFAGFFPAEDPQYTIVVVIKNKPHAANYYGSSVAGPVFKEIADRLYTTKVKYAANNTANNNAVSNTQYAFAGNKNDIQQITKTLQIQYNDNTALEKDWLNVAVTNNQATATEKNIHENMMPQLNGLGLKDALNICENLGLKVNVQGKGKVSYQSIIQGQKIAKGQVINIALN